MPFPSSVERWRELVRRHAPRDLAGDPAFERVALAVLMAESGGNPGAVGDEGASVGLFQLHERGMGTGLSVAQRSDPEVNAGRAVPALASAYQASRGDPVRTYIRAINPGATPDGPQVRGVLAAYASEGGGGGGKPLAKVEAQGGGTPMDATTTGDRPPSEFEPPSRFPSLAAQQPTSGVLTRIQRQLAAAQARRDAAQQTVDRVTAGAAAVDERLTSAERRALDATNRAALTAARSDLNAARNDLERLEREQAAEQDKLTAAAAKAPPASATKPSVSTGAGTTERYVLVTHPDGRQEWVENPNYTPTAKATRTYRAGGATISETAPDAGGFQPLPPDVQDPNALTSYQAGELGVQRAHLPIQQQQADAASVAAAASMLHAQVAKGQMDFATARQVFDYVVAQKAPVEEGGALYQPGRQPSSQSRQFFGLATQPYNVIDAAGFYGRPELNQYVRGSYPFGAGPMSPAEYHARQAGTFVPPAGGPAPGPPSAAAPGEPPPPQPMAPGAAPEPAGGFQPAPVAPPMAGTPAQLPPPQAPQMPSFGDPVAQGQGMIAQQEALQADLAKIVQALVAKGVDERTARAAAQQYLGAGATPATTPY